MKCQQRSGIVVCALIAAGSARVASAAAIVGSMQDSFADYAPGLFANVTPPSTSQNGGQGWNASGNLDPNSTSASWGAATGLNAGANRAVTSPGLTYSATGYLAPTGNKLTLDSTNPNATNNIGRILGGQTIDSGTTYFSYLTSRNNETQRTFNLAFENGSNERFSVGQIGTGAAGATGTNGNIGLLMNNSNPAGVLNNTTAPVAMGTGVTHLIIGRIDWNASGNETVSIWVDPTDVTTEAAVGAAYLSTNGFELTQITAIRPFSGNTNGSFTNVSDNFDEIRLGGTWESVTSLAVVPEPATMALACVGLFGLAGLGRRGRGRS